MTTTEHTLAYGELTNACTCMDYDDDTDTETPSEWCYGCWDDSLYSFGFAVEHLLAMSDTFRVDGLRLWDGEHSGVFHARTVADFVRGITVNSAWVLRYEVFSDRMNYSLSHHDAPCGSATTVRPIMEETE